MELVFRVKVRAREAERVKRRGVKRDCFVFVLGFSLFLYVCFFNILY